ncbi:MAG: DNA-processing protein DprA, partial [Alphaproteobacteria bacterium]|nr:DNA-processing protein DprA [Alphaproteobacteria bacterium]
IVVASGMARGIDSAAHVGALEGGTVAVLAGGIDAIYPKENQPLYEEICQRGAIVSEIPPGIQPQAQHFPRRNRIISGLARGIVVVEAAKRSGSLITARLAGEQGREVFAVPGSPLDPRCRGANDLIRNGASLIESAADVIAGLEGMLAPPLAERRGGRYATPAGATIDEAGLATARKAIAELLGHSPVAVDEVVRETGMAPAVIWIALLELELAGRLDRQPGNLVALLAPTRPE